jgi:competence ComEA-like helix-hairpin-helix protein
MRKSHSIFVLGIIIATMCVSAFAADVQSAPSGVVNINTADAAQLSFLPRVGVKAAQRVVDYRTEHGPFRKATDLMQVQGFVDKTFERLNPYITLDGKTTLSAKVQGARKARTKSSRRSQPTNTASK